MTDVEEDAAYVVLSSNRTGVLRRLDRGNAIPAQIKDDTGLEYSRISESIDDLRERGLVELVVPEDTKRGRLYSITEHGEDVLDYMRENGMVDDN